mgnify:CR=1 FL=1
MSQGEHRGRKGNMGKGIALVAIGAVLTGGMAALAVGEGEPALAALYAQHVPAEGTETIYGLPLAWDNAQLFAGWYDAIRLTGDEAKTLAAALAPLRAPCCDDNPLAECCCERGGLICNVVRTARGLGTYLVHEGYSAAEASAAMEQWLRFVHGDYYLARALVEQGADPLSYGLFQPENGSCYRNMCATPLQDGGCGGMGPQVIVTRPTS